MFLVKPIPQFNYEGKHVLPRQFSRQYIAFQMLPFAPYQIYSRVRCSHMGAPGITCGISKRNADTYIFPQDVAGNFSTVGVVAPLEADMLYGAYDVLC